MLHVEFARRQRHWSQEKLGQRTGITQAFISLMELGRGIPTHDQSQRLARELDLPPEILLKPVVALTSESDAPREATARGAARGTQGRVIGLALTCRGPANASYRLLMNGFFSAHDPADGRLVSGIFASIAEFEPLQLFLPILYEDETGRRGAAAVPIGGLTRAPLGVF